MSVNLGTSTKSYATAAPVNRKILKTTEGKLVLFADIDGSIRYKTSSDYGVNWDISWTSVTAKRSATVSDFDCLIETSNDILIAYGNTFGEMSFRRLTYSSGTWTIGSAVIVLAGTIDWYSISLCKRSNGDLYIQSFVDYTPTSARQYISTTAGVTWGSNTGFTASTAIQTIREIPVGTKIWSVYQRASGLIYREYDTSWGAEQTIVASGITDTPQTGMAVLKISNSEIYVAGRTSSGIRIFKWNGSTWDAGTLLSDNASDNHPTLSNINNKPILVWRDYDGTNFNIAYRKWTGSTWDAQVLLTDDAAVDSFPSTIDNDLDNLYACWTTGAASPYTIFFDKVVIVLPPVQKTILSDAKIKALDKMIDRAPHNMTSNVLPTPYVASASTEYSGYEAYKCFDGDLANYWIATDDSGWIKLDMGSGNTFIIVNYEIKNGNEPTRAPKSWTFEGSNDNSNWDVLDTVSNEISWSAWELRSFNCDTITTAYRYFRLNISENNGDTYINIAELYFYTSPTKQVTILSDAEIINPPPIVNNKFETWTVAGVPGTSNGTCTNWTAYSENGGTFTRYTATFFRTYNAEIRSSSAAPINSIGGCISDAFTLSNKYITFFHQSPNVNVAITFYLLDASDNVLITQSITPQTAWTQEIIDVSIYIGQNVKVKFTQHTTSAGAGYTTYLDNVNASNILSHYPPDFSATYVKATTNAGSGHLPHFGVHPGTSLIGAWDNNDWQATSATNQRFHIDLGLAKIINKIYYENLHNSGASTNVGVKNFTLWGSNTAGDFADLTYANDGTWVAITGVSQSIFDQHTAANTPDPKYIIVTNNTAYRYYAFKFADNWGASGFMGFRRVELQQSELPTQKTILSDAKIKVVDNQQTITSDALITSKISKTILSDAKIKALDIQDTILSDSKIIDLYQKNILSDTKIKAIGLINTILSDAKISIPVLYDIINKFTFTKGVISDINNKVNTVIRVLSDVNNFINTCKGVISDITNKVNTKKLILNNITNDIRFLYDWQKAADGGLQSLGKEYITVSIGGVPQTDIDVDSVSISKDLSSAHTASFDLARAYDASKPAMEAIVIIKYNDWVLFTGYITQISPADDPEKIRINCQDEYWKQNKTNVYYNVGHKPVDDKELYYNTLAEALTTQHSWTPRIGNFVPESLTNFAVGKSDAISNLIKEMGNYEWFYDVDGTKKLWTAGQGSIIELERQTLGENIKLYDVINHSFEEDVENIVNKLRVQMGDKVIQKDNRNRTYTGYNYSSYHQFVTPAWDGSLELLSIQTASGYGLDHPNPIYSAEYSLVFKKYKMPYLDPKVSSWSDAHPPYVEIYSAGGYLGFVGPLHLQLEKVLKEGFTIDYENATITFNEPYFLYKTDANGQCIAVRAPIVKVFLWKKNYYTNTSSPSDDPETDISNPLMFFTDKMGTYLDTIIEDLNLSNLSIQEGYIQHDYLTGEDIVIPSWNDTEFAIDYANWQLSKTCDKKIKGNISITLDATCFYNIDLSKRVYIDGITDSPMNIIGMTYNISSFTVSLQLENSRYYNRSISIQSHGE